MSAVLIDLQNFVKNQAAADAALPSGERKYQAELVKDVLGQEAPNHKALKDLVELYHTEKLAA